jgi:LmbE family N-acetylglucosaminyl deacetylase
VSVVVIAPHMDDEVLGCGGLIQRFEDVTVVFVTESASDKRLVAGDGYVEYRGSKRVAEMEAASQILGYRPVRFGWPVHSLDRVPLVKLIERLELAVGETELVLVPAQSNDEDHNVVSRACRALRRPHFGCFSILEYQTWGCPGPMEHQLILPLTSGELADKVGAMAQYDSQVAPGGDYDELYAYSPESVRTYAIAAGRLVHAEAGEAYVPIRLRPNATTSRLLRG